MAKRKNSRKASRKVKVPGAKNSIDKMKYEIANEFGVNLGADATSRANGRVGGEITKRLIENGMTKKNNSNTSSSRKRKSTKNKK